LENYVSRAKKPHLIYRLAAELDYRGYKSAKLENAIIDTRSSQYIFMFARTMRKANIKKLQSAIIKLGSILHIARFACFIPKADRLLIENIVAESENPKAAYYYLQYVKHCNIDKLKQNIIKSKKPRYLFALAKLLSNKDELNLIQDLIIQGNSDMYVRLFAVHIKTANIEKLENRIIQTKNINEMKKFAKAVNSPRLSKLSLLF
jgi:hypothetical protein